MIKKLLTDYLYGGFPEEFTDKFRSGLRRRAVLINLFAPFAVLLCVVYSYIAFTDPRTVWVAYVILAALAAVLIATVLMRRTKDIEWAAHTLVAVAIPIQLSYLVTGGPLGQGYFWTIAWVPWAFLLLGRKKAIFWVGVLAVASLLLTYFDSIGIATVAYTLPQLFQALFMLFIASVLLFLYEQQAEFFEKLSYKALDALVMEKRKPRSKKSKS